MDRMQIQVRRAAQVNRSLDEPELPWWQACVLGHTEPTSFQLVHRTEKRVLAEVLFWTVAPEMQSEPGAIVWMWPIEPAADENAPHEVVFLVAESLRQFQQEAATEARCVSRADDDTRTEILRKLGFAPMHHGIVYQRKLGTSSS